MDQKLLTHFQSRQQSLPDYDQAWLRETRRQGLRHFEKLGFPGWGSGRKNERWKYTDTRYIADDKYWQRAIPFDAQVLKDSITSAGLLNLPANRLVFINGFYTPSLSQLPDLKDAENGLLIEDFAGALTDKPALVGEYLNRLPDNEKFPFAAINTGLLEHGAVISVPDHVELKLPVHLLFLSTLSQKAGSQTFGINPRVLVVGGKHSRFDLIEHYASISAESEPMPADGSESLTNTVSEVFLQDGANCRYIKIQQETAHSINLGACYVQQSKDSFFEAHAIGLGGALVRNDLNIRLSGDHAECNLYGLYAPHGREHVDNHICIEHIAPHCTSRAYYKGLVNDRGHAVFNGRIHIHPGAQKTDATLRNKNLLLSAQAEIDTKPELEIYADDVSCAHGATVGELDAGQLHYLESRGIGRQRAKLMLSLAFINEIIGQLPHAELREIAHKALAGRIET